MKSLMQGHGTEGKYLGLSPEDYPYSSSKVVILPIPFDKTTTYQQGADLGPNALIEASRNLEAFDIETSSTPHEEGIFTLDPIEVSDSESLYKAAYNQVLENLKLGKLVVTLGGEHSITPPLVKAHADHFGSISVLQFDAHADMIPEYEGNPYSHASAMARVKEIKGVKKIVSVGIRSMSAEEHSLVDPHTTFYAHQLHDGDEWMDKVVDLLSDQVYLTFDLDAFDSSIMPSTGTPEPGGLFWHQVTKLLKKVAKTKTIVGFDVVELCPIKGFSAPDFLAAKLVYKILSYITRFENEH
jgi:agmatinase